MSNSVGSQLPRSAGVEENGLSRRQFEYLTDVIGCELVTIDGNKVIIRMDSPVDEVVVPGPNGRVKTLCSEMPGKYGYGQVAEPGRVSHGCYFGAYVKPGVIGGDKQDSEFGHLWDMDSIIRLLADLSLHGGRNSCNCESCQRSNKLALEIWHYIAEHHPMCIPLVRVQLNFRTDGLQIKYPDYHVEPSLIPNDAIAGCGKIGRLKLVALATYTLFAEQLGIKWQEKDIVCSLRDVDPTQAPDILGNVNCWDYRRSYGQESLTPLVFCRMINQWFDAFLSECEVTDREVAVSVQGKQVTMNEWSMMTFQEQLLMARMEINYYSRVRGGSYNGSDGLIKAISKVRNEQDPDELKRIAERYREQTLIHPAPPIDIMDIEPDDDDYDDDDDELDDDDN